MALPTYVNECRYCKTRGGASVHTKINTPPSIGGRCPSSPNDKHAPMWVQIKK